MSRSLSKSLRFEIFKRDFFVCQYCGSHPPQVVLEVDHIVAVASGGSDDRDNLVTACFDCNRGKAARDLNVVPQSLQEKAAQIAEREAQLVGYNQIIQAHRDRIEADVWRVFKHWTGQESTTKAKFQSVKIFVDKLGVHEVLDAVDIANASASYGESEWRYFCGVCWNKIRDAGL